MSYKPLYDHIGHTQRPHISPLSFLKLHCTLLSLIGHKKQGQSRAFGEENKCESSDDEGKIPVSPPPPRCKSSLALLGVWHTVALVCTTTIQHALLCPCRRCIFVFLICVLVYFLHLCIFLPFDSYISLFSGISQHSHSLVAPLLFICVFCVLRILFVFCYVKYNVQYGSGGDDCVGGDGGGGGDDAAEQLWVKIENLGSWMLSVLPSCDLTRQ